MNLQEQLLAKLKTQGMESKLTPREKSILTFISNHPGCKSGDIASKLDIPSPTIKRLLANLVKKNLIEKFGSGPGTNYAIS
jgi:DNA-binding MarR family transcriptional regulator